jgi:drug/metabolite transporter (DMT)-like permease
MTREQEQSRGALEALAAAALFGAGAPVAKLLVPSVGAVTFAGFLYLGAGLALVAIRLASRAAAPREAPLTFRDSPLLLVVVVAGGMLAPWLLLVGLRRLPGTTASLLLNLETPLTIALATTLFSEHLGVRATAGAAAIVAGAVLVGARGGIAAADWLGCAAIAGACAGWALDTNVSQRLSVRDPVEVVRLKGLAAGAAMLVIARLGGEPLPTVRVAAAALLVGAVAYGLSLVLTMRALRLLGSARQAAYFATAPFIGAALSIPILGERLDVTTAVAAFAMAAGLALLLGERHGHRHAHAPLEHEHAHVHDEHHRHAHEGPWSEPHAHVHRHAPLVHDHPHAADVHHRHRHR